MLGTLNSSEIEQVLREQIIGRIGCHSNGTTYIVPVSYAYNDESVIVRSRSGMKVDVMRNNPNVCFEVEEFTNMGNWKTVISWGTFKEITDTEERKEALQILLQRRLPMISSEMAQLSPHWPFNPADVNTIEGVVYKIELKEKTGRYEVTNSATAVSKSFLDPGSNE
jgi:uncharacterized protein